MPRTTATLWRRLRPSGGVEFVNQFSVADSAVNADEGALVGNRHQGAEGVQLHGGCSQLGTVRLGLGGVARGELEGGEARVGGHAVEILLQAFRLVTELLCGGGKGGARVLAGWFGLA